MHPIERLRWVARSTGDEKGELAREAAEALALFDADPAGMVTACRRLLQRHPRNGALWWLACRVLESSEPAAEAWDAAYELVADQTEQRLAEALPSDAGVLIVGWPPTVARALVHRGDVSALVGDTSEGHVLARALGRAGVEAEVVAGHAIGTAAAAADLVLVEAEALSAAGMVAATGARAAVAVAGQAGTPVWAVVPHGHVLPEPIWSALASDLLDSASPWDEREEVVPPGGLTTAMTRDGASSIDRLLEVPTCPVAPELLRPLRD